MKALIVLLMFCLANVAVPAVLAQADAEAPSSDTSESATTDNAGNADNVPQPTAPSQAADKPQSKSKPDERVFKPSEEISEDTSVAFPVDI